MGSQGSIRELYKIRMKLRIKMPIREIEVFRPDFVDEALVESENGLLYFFIFSGVY